MTNIQYKHVLLLILLAFIWGSSFILMKKGLAVYSFAQVSCMRMFFTMLTLLPFALKNLSKIAKTDYKFLILSGIIGAAIPSFLFTFAQSHLNSSSAGILNALSPLFTLILGILFFKLPFKLHQTIGIVVGFIGAILLITSKPALSTINSDLRYGWFIVVATFCYAININIVKHYCQHISTIAISSISFLFIGILAGIYLFSSNYLALTYNNNGLNATLYIIILAVFGTALASLIYNYLIKQTTTLFAATVTYLMPIIALMWGFFDGEQITWSYFISLIIILFGVYFANFKK